MTITLKSKHRLKKRLWQQNDITDQRKWYMLPFSLQYPESRFYTQAVFSYIILDLKGCPSATEAEKSSRAWDEINQTA